MASNKRPYKRTSKTIDKKNSSFNYNKTKNVNKKKNNTIKKNDNTPKVRMDKERINDVETLDTSFLEGRISNKKNKAVKERLLSDQNNSNLIKYVLFAIIVLLILVGMIFIFTGIINFLDKIEFKKDSKEIVTPSPTIDIDLDNNYLFIGTFNTERLDFDDDYHYIKVSDDIYNTNHILNEMNKQVYRYNPTFVFIELGINELYVESNVDFVVRLGKIIDGIKENRPKAKIYVESIYPINREVDNFNNNIIKDYIDNEMIYTVNKEIKKMAESKNVKYLDFYSLLSEDNKLIEDYTDNGIYLNDKGYKVIYEEINNIIK